MITNSGIFKMLSISALIVAAASFLTFNGFFGSGSNNENTETGPTVKIPIIKLSESELKKIGITKIENGYSFLSQSCADGAESYEKEMLIKGYPSNDDEDIFRSTEILTFTKNDNFNMDGGMIDYAGWDLRKPSPIMPLGLNFTYHTSGGCGSGSSCFGFAPLIEERRDFFRELGDFFTIKFIKPKINPEEIEFLTINTEKNPYAAQIIPVFIPFYDEDGNRGDCILWYLPTPELVDMLPERYSSYIRENLNIISYLEDTGSGDLEIKPEMNMNYQNQKEIAGIKYIELTENELQQLNIRYTNNSWLIPARHQEVKKSEVDAALLLELKKSGISISKSVLNFDEVISAGLKENNTEYISFDNSKTKIFPLVISSLGKFWNYRKDIDYWEPASRQSVITLLDEYKSDDEEKKAVNSVIKNNALNSIAGIENLINVRILKNYSSPDDKKHPVIHEINLWYEITPDFINALPDRYSVPLSKEFNIIRKIEQGTIKPEKACDELKNDTSYMNVCETAAAKEFKLLVSPNPATDKITIGFHLPEASGISLGLYEITGNKIMDFIPFDNMSAGIHDRNFNLNGLSQGVYLLILKLENGKTAMKKLIIQ